MYVSTFMCYDMYMQMIQDDCDSTDVIDNDSTYTMCTSVIV